MQNPDGPDRRFQPTPPVQSGTQGFRFPVGLRACGTLRSAVISEASSLVRLRDQHKFLSRVISRHFYLSLTPAKFMAASASFYRDPGEKILAAIAMENQLALGRLFRRLRVDGQDNN